MERDSAPVGSYRAWIYLAGFAVKNGELANDLVRFYFHFCDVH
jgi:hypothetical protein